METDILKARIADTADICDRTQKAKFLGFLSKEESILAERMLEKRVIKFILFGGYSSAERVLLGCFPDWDEECIFPITAVTFNFRKTDVLGHRDFLGSLMALGITRESVGDILIEEGRAVAFVADEIADYIVTQISKIGRIGVTVTKGYTGPLPQKGELSEFSCTIASERLDCIVAAICNISRGIAAQKITEGLVLVNSVVTEKSTKTIIAGDAVTVRGKGKFIIDSIADKTRKDRIILKYKKYV